MTNAIDFAAAFTDEELHRVSDAKLNDLPATITIPHAGRILGLNRTQAYAAAKRGTIPTIELSPRRKAVPTAKLRALLGANPHHPYPTIQDKFRALPDDEQLHIGAAVLFAGFLRTKDEWKSRPVEEVLERANELAANLCANQEHAE